MKYEPKEVILTLEELTSLCAEWQVTLQLADWSVALAILRGRDMRDADSQAQCYYVQRTKEARIAVIDPVDYPSTSVFPQDMEQSLVHELVHLHFAPLWDDREAYEILGEQGVNCLANALVASKREGGNDDVTAKTDTPISEDRCPGP